jgi:hypothetical protein
MNNRPFHLAQPVWVWWPTRLPLVAPYQAWVEEEEAEEEAEAEAEAMEVHRHPIYSRNHLPHYIEVLFVVCTVMGLTTSVQVKV